VALTRLAHAILLSWGWRRALIAFLAGAASALAMEPYGLFPVLFLTFPVLVWLVDGASAADGLGRRLRAAAWVGWLFGFGYFLAGLWWIGSAFLVDAQDYAWLMPFAVVGLPAGLALFPALGVAASRLFWSSGWGRIFVLGVGLGGSEWLRGHILTGFPWNSFGYALADNAVLGQIASVTGVEGLTPLVITLFAAPALLAEERPRSWWPSAGALALLAAIALFGAVRLNGAELSFRPNLDVRIMQPNVPQDEKFSADFRDEIMARYLALSNEATSPDHPSAASAQLIVWPESAFPFFLARTPEALAQIAGLLAPGSTLLTGAARIEAPQRAGERPAIYNSIYAIGDDGTITATYDKVHLVPFGEFLPFQDTLERWGIRQLTRLPGGFSAGDRPRNMTLPDGLTLAPMICYEAIFPDGTIDPDKRPDAILNVTNDAWFGMTPGPYQHLGQARVRAIEQGLPLIRAANTGISAMIDPWGRPVRTLGLGAEGVLDAALPVPLPPTLYSRGGWLIVSLIYALLVFGAWIATPRFDFVRRGNQSARPAGV